MDKPLSESHWQAVGAFFARMHLARPIQPLSELLNREQFNSKCLEVAQVVLAEAFKPGHSELSLELAVFIRERDSEISRIIERTQELGRRLWKQQPKFALCHGDPNTSNIFVTDQDKLYILDWDEVILAPRERDLMFFDEAPAFWQGYDPTGRYKPDLTALAYYKYEWVVQEIADFGGQVFSLELNQSTKRHALAKFFQLFDPEDVVEIAYGADKALESISG